jgi:hypothetical protein
LLVIDLPFCGHQGRAVPGIRSGIQYWLRGQIFIAVFGSTAPLISVAFVSAGQLMYVAFYIIAIVALCLMVYLAPPETGSRGQHASLAPTDLRY